MSNYPSDRSPSNGAVMPALLLFGGITLMLLAAFAGRPSQHQYTPAEITATVQVRATNQAATEIALLPTATVQIVQPTEVVEVAQALDPVMVSAGENTFQSVCSACHGFTGQGIPGLGKPLVNSAFIDGLTDEELLAFIIHGRDVSDPQNTTGVPMPARGGNPGLSDADLLNVIAYIHSLNADAIVADVPTSAATSGPTATPIVFQQLPLSSGDATAEATSVAVEPTSAPNLFASNGEALYVGSCAGCHGVDGAGLPYLTSSLKDSELVTSFNGFGLQDFLTKAHPPINPEEAFPHPYRGGYPELTDAQIQEVIAYLYTLPG
jgi:mono/diheme cytochrome c family protein